MSSRWLVAAMFLSFAVSTIADEPGQSIRREELGSILEKAQLEHWAKDSTAPASPRFGVITVIDKDRGILVITEKMVTAVQEQRAVVIFGDERKEQPVVKFIIATTHDRYSLEERPVYDVDGKRIEQDEALKRLEAGRVVVLSSDGKMVDPRYRKTLRRDTLILIPPVVEPLHERELQTVSP